MASVILLDTEGGEVEVSEPYIFVSLVYGRGYRPQTGTIAENLDILTAGGGPLDEAAILVYLHDLENPASDAYQAIAAIGGSGGTHSHAEYIDEAELTAALATKADDADLAVLAPLESPTFTGTVGGITKAMVGLGSVDNTSDAAKPVSTAQQTALNLKANLASPTFTGTVGGITKSMVGLGNVDNTADSAKPVSTAQQTALNGKANTSHTHVYSDVTDILENIQDAVAAMVAAGTGITKSYDDATGVLTINATGGGGSTDPEVVRDTIGSALVQGAGITITLNDAGDTITIASTAVLPTRQVIAGTGLSGGGDLSTDRTFTVSYGSTAGTAVQGNDARVTADQAVGTASIRTLGTGAQQAAAGNDTRIVNAVQTSRSISTTAPLSGGGDLSANRTLTVATASETAVGVVELATTSEATTGTDTARAVTPAGVKAVADTKAALSHTHTAANISDSTATGRSVLTATDAAAARTAISAGRVDSTDGTILNVVKLTQSAYDALGTKVATTLYVIVG